MEKPRQPPSTSGVIGFNLEWARLRTFWGVLEVALCNKYKIVNSYIYLVASKDLAMESVETLVNRFKVHVMPRENTFLCGRRAEAFQMTFIWSHELEDDVEVIIIEKGSSGITFSLHGIKAAENLELLVY